MIDKRTRLTGSLQFKTQRPSSSVEIDGKTIIKDEEGRLQTAVGGFIDEAGNIHKIDSRFILTDEEALEVLSNTGIVQPLASQNSSLFVDNANKIFIL